MVYHLRYCKKFMLKSFSCKDFEITKRDKHLVDDTDDEVLIT